MMPSLPRRTPLRRVLMLALAAVAVHVAVPVGAAEPAPRVTLETTAGRMVLELDAAKAPVSVANFVQYVKDGFYDGTVFHRVIPTFMVQGGGFSAEMKEKPTRAAIANESRNGLKNDRGTIAMARRGDPNSATAQFFINVVDNPRLDYPSFDGFGYAVFGKVVEGMDVVDKIRQAPTQTVGAYENVPVNPIVIKSARLAK